MLFNSEEFIFIFLPMSILLLSVAERLGREWFVTIMLVLSLAFYSYWDFRFTPLLICSIGFNFLAAKWIDSVSGSSRLALLYICLALNLGLLIIFKYANLLVGAIFPAFGLEYSSFDIVLPLGISFFTFTQIAYLVDIYRREVERVSLLEYSVFVSYFPHAIAGPLLNFRQFMPQLKRARIISMENLHAGLSIFSVGLAKKVLIADNFALTAEEFFAAVARGDEPTMLAAWGGVLAYSFQIYFDFSGYSDMAVGLSRCFGIQIPYNFLSPYRAANIKDFWKRWHISLSYFLQRYLYIPLGGNRSGRARHLANLLITMCLGGIWHGANWTFLIWGGLHGGYLIFYHVWKQVFPRSNFSGNALSRFTAQAFTFLAVTIAWVFFRAPDVSQAMTILRAMVELESFNAIPADFEIGLSPLLNAFSAISFEKALVSSIAIFICFRCPSTLEIFETHKACFGVFKFPESSLSMFHGIIFGLAVLKILNFEPSVFLYFQF